MSIVNLRQFTCTKEKLIDASGYEIKSISVVLVFNNLLGLFVSVTLVKKISIASSPIVQSNNVVWHYVGKFGKAMLMKND